MPRMLVRRRSSSTLLLAVLALALVTTSAAAVPFWGDKQSMPPETTPSALKPGQFVWEGDVVGAGPVVIHSAPADVAHPAALVPVDAATGKEIVVPHLAPG
jgi:hypothetical protein